MTLTIELDSATAETVQVLAAEQQRSANEIVRDAICAYAQPGVRELPAGIGQYRSGQSDVAVNARQILRNAVSEQRWP